jgi:hypothetical protein
VDYDDGITNTVSFTRRWADAPARTRPDGRSRCWRGCGDGDGNSCDLKSHDLKPDSRSWNAIINTVARSRDPDCANRARSLLEVMGGLYNMGDSDFIPNALTFCAVTYAHANSSKRRSKM